MSFAGSTILIRLIQSVLRGSGEALPPAAVFHPRISNFAVPPPLHCIAHVFKINLTTPVVQAMGVLLESVVLCPAPAAMLSPRIGGALISLLCLELSRLCIQVPFPDLRYLVAG